MLNGREVVVGVTGGVAAYKTAMLVSQLVQAGAGVSVVLTASATQFVGAATFAALTGRKVHEHGFDESHHPLGPHIDLAAQGELLCVAPATANFLSKVAQGAADDLLSTLVLAFGGPVILAPAMNNQMWDKPAVQRNVNQVRADGYTIVGPEEGWLSCRTRAVGRMAAPETIAQAIAERLAAVKSK